MFENLNSKDIDNIINIIKIMNIIDFMKNKELSIEDITNNLKGTAKNENRNPENTGQNGTKEMKMKEFEDTAWEADWKQVLENRKNNPNKNATDEQLNKILEKIKDKNVNNINHNMDEIEQERTRSLKYFFDYIRSAYENDCPKCQACFENLFIHKIGIVDGRVKYGAMCPYEANKECFSMTFQRYGYDN